MYIKKLRDMEIFGKNISHLINAGDIANQQLITKNLFSDKIHVQFNMFCSNVEDRIMSEMSGTLVVTLDKRSRNIKTKFLQQGLDPYD